jgi:hypothetical protein
MNNEHYPFEIGLDCKSVTLSEYLAIAACYVTRTKYETWVELKDSTSAPIKRFALTCRLQAVMKQDRITRYIFN